jgi:SAM-dependent methyltransferase
MFMNSGIKLQVSLFENKGYGKKRKRSYNMSEYKHPKDQKHHHRGKSSESLLDKTKILESLAIVPGQVILDAGCGNGYMAKEFAEVTGNTGKVYALDPDTIAIDVLKSEATGTAIEPIVGDITKETKLAMSSIDLIYLSTVMHGDIEKAPIASIEGGNIIKAIRL